MKIESTWHTEETLALRDKATQFYTQEFIPRLETFEQNRCVDRDLWRKAGEMGLLCCSIPTEYGGGGGTFAHDLAVTEAAGRMPGVSWGITLHGAIIANYLLAYGSDEQKQRWLPKMASGELIAAIAMTEPAAGSDLKAMRSTALLDGDDYVINGTKTFIANGTQADLVVVAARTSPDPSAKSISLLIVETAAAPGLTVGPSMAKQGQRSHDMATMTFDNVRVSTANLLGLRENQGFAQLMSQLRQERIVLGISAVTAMETAVDLTIAHTKSRELFGKTSFELQNTRFVLAEAKTKAHVGRLFIDSCITQHLAGELDPTTAAMCKWWLSEIQCEVIDACLQLYGGYGYLSDQPIARLYADARVQKIYGGANEVMKELIARSL